jgi:hypothetical protein
MKKISLLLISSITAMLLLFAACEKVGKVCEVSDPITELPWLVSMKGQKYISISKAILKDKKKGKRIEGFLIHGGSITTYYNCSGEEICYSGGFTGSKCNDYEVIKKEVIYENP